MKKKINDLCEERFILVAMPILIFFSNPIENFPTFWLLQMHPWNTNDSHVINK